MQKIILAALLTPLIALPVAADSFGKPCTTVPSNAWLSMEAIEKIVTDHGFTITKSRLKGTCAEVYVKDGQGLKAELFIDPATGNPVGTDWTRVR
ncbi:MAG: PepSY domain-containing protein [Hyphomicrobium sp.]|jgi:hypothetical protein|nr:PepSY domain-containing protein [Hyphomicrobium sp.]